MTVVTGELSRNDSGRFSSNGPAQAAYRNRAGRRSGSQKAVLSGAATDGVRRTSSGRPASRKRGLRDNL